MFRPIHVVPPDTRIDFMRFHKITFAISVLMVVGSLLLIFGRGLNFGIDFESGTRITTPLQQEASVDDVRDALPSDLRDAKIQEVEDSDLGPNVVQIATPTLEPGEVDEVRVALDDAFGVTRADFDTESIGPTFGEQIARTALIAVIASLLLISIYIGLRFEFKYAVPVLIALTHDLLITAGVYALTEREVTSATVAALLTIMGYSLYDTIIVFDRIRENMRLNPGEPLNPVINFSLMQTLARSIITSLTVLLTLLVGSVGAYSLTRYRYPGRDQIAGLVLCTYMLAPIMIVIPFFVLAGAIMAEGGMARRLVALAGVFVGFIRGGLSLVNIMASTFFGAISGSSVADTASIGSVLIPEMEKKGYPRKFAAAVTISGSVQAILIPPSHNAVIYSLAAGGTISIALQKRGVGLINARRTAFTVGALLMMGVAFVGTVDSPYVAVALLSLAGFAHQTLSVTVITRYSAGMAGAIPISQVRIPRSTASGGLVSASHFT